MAWAGSAAATVGATEIAVSVELTAADSRLAATQTITVGEATREFGFSLNEALAIVSAAGDGQAAELTRLADGQWRAVLDRPVTQLTLRYSGRPALSEAPLGNYFDRDGAWLSAASAWYARPVNTLASTELRVRNDAGWSCLSQGRELSARDADEQHWLESGPQRDLQLVCAPFHRYAQEDGAVSLQAWLRSPDEALATRYLDAARRQLALFEPLLGPYPYAKFALVENRAQTGFGMASFTLLGDRVIRLPFILESSFPHELVHNWLGNGVYVDPAAGNWSEGLTTYLSDYGLAERSGHGRAHRRKALTRLSVQTAEHPPYPMTEFRSRSNARIGGLDSAIGYDRAMLVFHQLRLELGDEGFRAGLRHLVERRLYQPTRFDELGQLLAADDDTAAERMTALLEQWLLRPGLPALALEDVELRDGALHAVIRQLQQDDPYDLRVEAVVTLEDGRIVRKIVALGAASAEPITIPLAAAPRRLDIDPGNHALRRLSAQDRARHVAETLAASPVAFIHPSAPEQAQVRYRRAARALGATTVKVGVAPQPLDVATLLLGSGFGQRASVESALAGIASADTAAGSRHAASLARDTALPRGDHTPCRALALGEGEAPALWLDCDSPAGASYEALGRFVQVLPRYGSRGLVVAGGEARQRARAYDAPWPDGSLSVVWQPGTALPPDATRSLLGDASR